MSASATRKQEATLVMWQLSWEGEDNLGTIELSMRFCESLHNIWSRCMNVSIIGACRSLRTSVPSKDGLPSVKMLVGTFNKSLNNCKTFRENR